MPIVPQKITGQQFAALDRPEQLDILCRVGNRKKLQLLFDAADGDELLALLPPQDLFLLARELGADQIPELLGMATPEQWTAFFDFDCWTGDRFDAGAARPWLAVLLDGEEPRIVEILLGLNFELLTLILLQEVQVVSGPEELESEAERGEALRRDGGYLLEYRDEEGAKLYGALLDILFRHHADFFRYLLEAVRAEDESLLEESVYRQRADRLVDQGFSAPDEARAVYAWLDPERYTIPAEAKIPLGGSATGAAPGALLQLARPGGTLALALAGGIDAGTAWELTCLINRTLLADGADCGDIDEIRAVAGRTLGLLNLALEYLAGNDADKARHCLDEEYAERLFRLGFSLTLRLRQRARAVVQSAVGPLLDRRFRDVIEPLLPVRPQFPVAARHPGQGGAQPFAALQEVRLVEAWLDQMEVQRRLFEDHFRFPLPAAVDDLSVAAGEPTLSALFLTALANRLLGRPFMPQPLVAGDVRTLHGLVTRGRLVDPELRRQTLTWLDSLEAGGSTFGEYCLGRWDDEFCAVAVEALDPRYLGGLIVSSP
ncbi:MAG: hypothetical protein FDZ69_05540 [Deltaproteobacteria bacterium]|nr:MAG: hypothetical protein FDZ69_05540 [Deltaproteobacteria bacterium]